eukprot:5463406-Prymnesium_polylepis.1
MSKPGRRAKSAAQEAPKCSPVFCDAVALGLRCGGRSGAEIRRCGDPDAVADGCGGTRGDCGVRGVRDG